MIPRREYRYTERCLYDYPRNAESLRVLSAELGMHYSHGDIHIQRYDASPGASGGYSNPVLTYLQRADSLERSIIRLNRIVIPITLYRERLVTSFRPDAECRFSLLEAHYFRKGAVADVMREHGLTRRRIYAMRRRIVEEVYLYLCRYSRSL